MQVYVKTDKYWIGENNMHRYSKLIEHVTSGNEERAAQVFHDIVVTEALRLYEAMESEEELDDDTTIGGDASDDLIADISTEENGDAAMEAAETPTENKPEQKKPSRSVYKSEVVPNQAKLIPAPKPVNTQADHVNNLTPFPKVN